MDIQPVREAKNDHPTIGIIPADGLSIAAFLPPAGMADPPAYPGLDRLEADEFDRHAGGGRSRRSGAAAAGEPRRLRAAAGTRTANGRSSTSSSGDQPSAGEDGPVKERFELTLPRGAFRRLRPAIDRRADQRHPGRLARGVGRLPRGGPHPQGGRRRRFRPDAAARPLLSESAGKPMTFEVERAAADGGRKTQTLTVTPDDSPPWDWTAAEPATSTSRGWASAIRSRPMSSR